jgi:two-component system response regulator ResD
MQENVLAFPRTQVNRSAAMLARQILINAVEDLISTVQGAERPPRFVDFRAASEHAAAFQVLSAMLESLVGAAGSAPQITPSEIRFAHVRIDLRTRSVFCYDEDVSLTPLEFDLLYRFAREPNVLVSKDQMIHDVWAGQIRPESRTIDQHILELRKKLDLSPGRSPCLRTMPKRGYILVVDGDGSCMIEEEAH